MKYEKILQKVKNATMSRKELHQLKDNAEIKLAAGDKSAQMVLDAITISSPSDPYVLFMGFCPDGNINNRLDREWKEKGICRFDYMESEMQANRFNQLLPGDLVVLKKIQKYGKSMCLYGHGRITSIEYDTDKIRYFKMRWSAQEDVIEVPLMGCNATVNVKEKDKIAYEMPDSFYSWLNG